MIQTQFPEHPLLQRLIAEGYESFAASALEERREAGMAAFLAPRAAARPRPRTAQDWTRTCAPPQRWAMCSMSPPPKSPLRKRRRPRKAQSKSSAPRPRDRARADHFRAHLLIEATVRSSLQRFLAAGCRRWKRWPVPKVCAGRSTWILWKSIERFA